MGQLLQLPESTWISFVLRDGRPIPASGDALLQAGDEVMLMTDPRHEETINATFTSPADEQ